MMNRFSGPFHLFDVFIVNASSYEWLLFLLHAFIFNIYKKVSFVQLLGKGEETLSPPL